MEDGLESSERNLLRRAGARSLLANAQLFQIGILLFLQVLLSLLELFGLELFLLLGLFRSCLSQFLQVPGFDHLALYLSFFVCIDHCEYRHHALLFDRMISSVSIKTGTT